MTLAVMGFPLYRRFGYIYHPDYTSVYADNEQTEVCLRLKRLAVSPECVIRHEWTPEPFDALHARNNNGEMYKIDKAVYDARQTRGFDIDAKFWRGAVRPGPAPIHALSESRIQRSPWRRFIERALS